MKSSHFMEPVKPVQPFAGYIGGKRNLAQRIIERIDHFPHRTYAEPFVGLGGVFFRRKARPKAEVINDISGDVATTFRVLQEHYPYLIDILKWRLTSRNEFQRLMAQDPATLTDLRRAARFIYLQRTAFGGKVMSRHFGVDPANPARFNLSKIEPLLADVHDRLAGVSIEQLNWDKFIARYDRAGTLFYCDPPYHGNEADYGPNVFSADDFTRMADVFGELQGAFLLSINDTPDIRRIFGAFAFEEIETTYSLPTALGGAQRASELLISNRPELFHINT